MAARLIFSLSVSLSEKRKEDEESIVTSLSMHWFIACFDAPLQLIDQRMDSLRHEFHS
jgi:hypothetical protein